MTPEHYLLPHIKRHRNAIRRSHLRMVELRSLKILEMGAGFDILVGMDINIRPAQGNTDMEVSDPQIRERIKKIVDSKII